MSITIIENDFLRVAINATGAELCSVFNKQTSIEYLWQAGAAWGKHAPVLFPIVGQLKHNTYVWKNKTYSMERHGLARTRVFAVEETTPRKAVFVLHSNEETLAHYPFAFTLRITYTLEEQTVRTLYEVVNNQEEAMYFSIGAHPAFNVPLLPNEYYSDYYLAFNQKENAQRWLLKDNLIDKPVNFFSNENILPLSHSLFKEDALVFKCIQSDVITLRCNKSEHGLHFTMKGYPYLGLWAAKNANFVCIEPWHGIADGINATGNLMDKEGMLKLDGGKFFSCTYTIETF